MNFIFFSKLLPLFIYPLGLACLLLIVALILVWKKSSFTPLPIISALIILLLASNSWVSDALISSLEWQYLPQKEIPPAEAIVVLGGATKPAIYPRPMVDINENGDRLFYAAKLYHEQKAPIIIVAGGRIKWGGYGESESKDMKQLLLMMGVKPEDIIEEPDSLNTYQNAVNVNKILQERGIKQILLVTSALHIPRSLLIFQHQGIKTIPAPTDFLVSQSTVNIVSNSPQQLLLNMLPDAQHLAKTTKAIKEYIGIVIYRLRGWL